jgi:hypothetical protein
LTEKVDQIQIAIAKHIVAVFRIHKHGTAANEWLYQAISFRQCFSSCGMTRVYRPPI